MKRKHRNRGRLAAAILIAAAVALAILIPLTQRETGPEPRIRGEIQQFNIARNPQPAPEVGFADASGGAFTLADFRGRVVLVNFWATWCAPCVDEMPELDALQGKLGGDRFEVVALNLDRDGEAVARPFMEKLSLKNLALYFDTGFAAQRAFEVAHLPTTILIDAEGREVGRLLGAADWTAPEAIELIQYVLGGKG